jgi:hypothetical protein
MSNCWSLEIFKKDFVDGLLFRITDCVGMMDKCGNGSTFSLRTEKYFMQQRYYLLNMEHWWNENDDRKPQYLDYKLSQCLFVQHKFHTDLSRI